QLLNDLSARLTDKLKDEPLTLTHWFAEQVGASPRFPRTTVEMSEHTSVYSIEKYVALLSTLSDYIALSAETRQQLLNDLSARLTDKLKDEPLTLTHWFAAQVAPLVADA
ncbi:MAG: hypothetical protein AAGL17_05445, partial [Cyanobacteria bacterium J06576_12]